MFSKWKVEPLDRTRLMNSSEPESLDKAVLKKKKQTLIGVLDFVLFDSWPCYLQSTEAWSDSTGENLQLTSVNLRH